MPVPTPTVEEQWDARGADVGDDGSLMYPRAFLVNFGSVEGMTSEEKQQLESLVAGAVDINRWDPHPAEPRATCRTVSIKPEGAPHVWRATYTYTDKRVEGKEESEAATAGTPEKPGNEKDTPAQDRNPTIAVSKRTKTVIMEKDANGDDVVNSAGDGFDPPLEREKTNVTYTLKFFRLPANLNWGTRKGYLDTVNDAAVTIFGLVHDEGTLRCTSMIPTMIWETGDAGALMLFFEIAVEWEHDPDGWNASVLDQGRREKLDLGGGSFEMRQITDETGQPPADPVPLDSGLQWVPPTAMTYLDFVRYPSSTFANHVA